VFFISSALRGESCGRISVVEPKGSFIFSPNETKFQRTATFPLPENLISIYPAIRKVNETKNTIFCLNGYGFYFIDTLNRKLSYYKLFKYPNFDNCDYGISNDERLLATCLHESFQDPLDGAYKWRYWLTVYNLSNGEELGEHILPSIEVINRTLSFNEDNSELSVISNTENYCFELKYAP
jgi:hypothetical protein